MVYRRTPRSEQIREAARTRILDAATTLFSEKGYDDTTMQDVVRKAKTSIGNAYFYFPSKRDLLVELVGNLARDTWDRSEAAVASVRPGPARIAAIIYLNVAVFNPKTIASLLISTDQRFSSIGIVRDVVLPRWIRVLEECFPGIDSEERKLAAAGIFGVNRSIVELRTAGEVDRSPKQLARFAAQWALRGLGVPEHDITAALKVAARRSAGRLE